MSFRPLTLVVACGLAGCSTSDLSVQPFRAAALTEPRHNAPLDPAPRSLQSGLRSSAVEEVGQEPVGMGSPWSWLTHLRGDGYALDDIGRRLDPKATVKCDASALRTYKGTSVAYAGSVLVDPAFTERLARFETIVNRVALDVYGRPPSRLLHAGAYACRKSRNRSTRLSEHALGNALDVVGFSFAPATKAQRATTPKHAQGAFRVTVGQHWNAERSELGRLNRQFLRALADEVVDADVFRVVLGPSHPGHGDHLHFDMSPWNYTHL